MPQTAQVNNTKRIAKNTLLLYVRMLLLMLISLYTSRVILNALGVVDYGIYEVVGGVVTMFSVLSGSLNAAISRFLTFELGKNNQEKLQKIFSSAVTIQIIISVIIVIIAETIGLWFLNSKLLIPADRLQAANWCYQFSVATFVINLISVPYNSVIIAHEKMSAFAYISILEALGKLVVAWCIVISPIDKLIFYAVLMASIALPVRMVYVWYCKKNFRECNYHLIFDYDLLKQMFGFAGWNFIGASSAVLRDQGGNVIVNLFYGPVVNAAYGIASRVNTAVVSFVQNFMMAMNPQITKSYASGDFNYMFKLVFQGARFSYYILLLICIPILLNTRYILVLWLTNIPDHTVLFVRLILVFTLSESISGPLITAMLATGTIRNYQIVVGGMQMLNLPISYLCLHFGALPETIILVSLVISQCCLAARLIMLKGLIDLNIKDYFRNVYLNVAIVTLFSVAIPSAIAYILPDGLRSFVIVSLIALINIVIVELYIGCTKTERQIVFTQANKIKKKFRLEK